MRFKLILLLFISIKLLSVSSQTRDTIYQGKYYNTVTYYNEGNIRDLNKNIGVYYYSIGISTNGLLDGPIIFFYPTGKIMAKGKFKKGKKLGKWTYFSNINEEKTMVNYSKKSSVKTYYVINEFDNLEIQDVVKNKKETFLLVNGVKTVKKTNYFIED